ncbi:MAG: DUF4270 family protein [Saprospiraceae bacterium]|nr:DUF4270 family protein [Saprospiraceae bacterium]
MQFRKFIIVGCLLLLISTLFVRCNDPILVGGDLLDSEKFNIGYSDNFILRSETVEGRVPPTYINGTNTQTYMIGQLDDPVFGKISAELYLFNFLQPNFKPTFTTTANSILFDSLVLVLQLDTMGTYGAETATHKIELFQLNESYRKLDTILSNTQFDYNTTLLAQNTLEIRPKDSISLKNHINGNVIKQPAQVRLKLNDDFGRALITNNTAATNDTAFVDYIKGFFIRSTPLTGPSLMGFNFSINSLNTQQSWNKLIMYYTEGDTLKKQYEYPIHTATANRFVHNRNGSALSDFVNVPSNGDSLCFIQGMGGAKTVIHFDDISFLSDKTINSAVLEITVADNPSIPGYYPAASQLYASRTTDAGKLELIADILPFTLQPPLIDFRISFGGGLQTTGGLKKYSLNVTNHLKAAIKNPDFKSEILLSPVPVNSIPFRFSELLIAESSTPGRVVLYGAKHSQYPMKLKVSYTEK